MVVIVGLYGPFKKIMISDRNFITPMLSLILFVTLSLNALSMHDRKERIFYLKLKAKENSSFLLLHAEIRIHQIQSNANCIIIMWQSRCNKLVISVAKVPHFSLNIPLKRGKLFRREN